jgi:hypothetical protein
MCGLNLAISAGTNALATTSPSMNAHIAAVKSGTSLPCAGRKFCLTGSRSEKHSSGGVASSSAW